MTKQNPNDRSRGWIIVRNNYTEEDMALCIIEDLSYRYLCVGFEIGPECGTPHLQGYVYFNEAKTRKTIKEKFPHWWVDPQKGSFTQASEYCSKWGENHDIWENGDPPTPGRIGRDKIEGIMKDPWANFHLFQQYKKTYQALVAKDPKPDRKRKLMMIPENLKYVLPNVFMEYDLELYEDERVVVWPYGFRGDDIERWLFNIPVKFRRGYEVFRFDPDIIYLVWKTVQEKHSIIKKYADYIDGVCETKEELQKEGIETNEHEGLNKED